VSLRRRRGGRRSGLAGFSPRHDPHDLLEASHDFLVVEAVAAVVGDKLAQVGDDLLAVRIFQRLLRRWKAREPRPP
jgi:hypothetical protein